MQKILLFLFSILMCSISSYGTDSLNVTIYYDSTIQLSNLSIDCNNGLSSVRTDGSVQNKITFKAPLFAKYGTLSINYIKDDAGQYNQYWFTDAPAEVYLTINDSGELTISSQSKNVIDIFGANKALKSELDSFTVKQTNEITLLYNNRGNYSYEEFAKQSINVTGNWMRQCAVFIRGHNDNYFYYWYFVDQFIKSRILTRDSLMLRELTDTIKSIFSPAILATPEARDLLKNLSYQLRVLTEGPTSILTSIKDIDNNAVELKNFKEKLLLLDFWASWCRPCIQAIPSLKKLRTEFSLTDLKIVGVNCGEDSVTVTQFIKKEALSWPQAYNINNGNIEYFGVGGIPRFVIINQKGDILYNEVGYGEPTEDRLRQVIKNALK